MGMYTKHNLTETARNNLYDNFFLAAPSTVQHWTIIEKAMFSALSDMRGKYDEQDTRWCHRQAAVLLFPSWGKKKRERHLSVLDALCLSAPTHQGVHCTHRENRVYYASMQQTYTLAMDV